MAHAQTSRWDRAPARPAQGSILRADHQRPVEPRTADVWEEFRSAWTPIDQTGRTLRDVNQPPVVTPAVTRSRGTESSAAPSSSAPVPLSGAVIQWSLQATQAPPCTAGSLLRGNSSHDITTTAAGFARLASSPASDISHAALEAPPFPTDESWTNSRIEDRAYRLFDVPGQPAYAAANDSSTSSSIWDRARASEGDYRRVGGEELLLAPIVDDAAAAAPPDREVGTVMLDGLDAVASGVPAKRNPYESIPLSQIRPYRTYSTDGGALCPDPSVRCPEVKPLPESWEPYERTFAHMDFLWVPSNVFYSPLYFEDPALERYGHTHGPLLQPLASTSRFGLQLIGLPYQMALDPPHRRVYPLGFFRPGECAPKQVPNVPLNAEAAAKAGAVYTGLIFAFP